MNEYEIRKPIQKRSIEKKEKIIQSGFELICKKGYYNTNTAEIAKNASVSTGIVYQYFKDKHDIFIEALKNIDDQEIIIELTTSISPVIIKPITSNKYIYILLPIKLLLGMIFNV